MIATSVSHYPKVGNGSGQQALRQAIARFDRGENGRSELSAVADAVTVEAIREQEAAGLDLVTDGQIRWQDPLTYICSRLEGFEIAGLLRWFESNTYYRQPVAVAPIRWERPVLVEDLRFARAHAERPVKAVVTGPYTIATLSETRLEGGRGRLALEVAAALNQELRALAAESPVRIQVDEPAITANRSVGYPRDMGLFAEAMAALVEGVDAPLSLYLYHGSAEDIPGLLEMPFDLFGLDLVQGAAGWRLLEEWPRGKGVGLGIVDARNVRMEDPAALAAMIARGVAAAGEERVHVSPSCGLEFLPRETAFAKLRLVVSATRAAEGAPA